MDFQNEEIELDIGGLLYHLRKKLRVIAVVVLVCALVGFCVSAIFITPKYTASTRMYVLNRSSDRYASSDFVIASYMLNDYKVLITGQNVTKEVINDLRLDMKPGELAGNIEVTSPDSTRVLQIDYTDTDPQRAAQIANAIREEAVEQLQSIMEVDAVKLVYKAEAPQVPSSPNVMQNTVLAAVLSFTVMVGWYTFRFIRDDSIRTEEDVARYLGLSTLGVIPAAEDLSTEHKKNKKKQFAPGNGRKK